MLFSSELSGISLILLQSGDEHPNRQDASNHQFIAIEDIQELPQHDHLGADGGNTQYDSEKGQKYCFYLSN